MCLWGDDVSSDGGSRAVLRYVLERVLDEVEQSCIRIIESRELVILILYPRASFYISTGWWNNQYLLHAESFRPSRRMSNTSISEYDNHQSDLTTRVWQRDMLGRQVRLPRLGDGS